MNDIDFAIFCIRSCGLQADHVGDTTIVVLSHEDKIAGRVAINKDTTVLELRDAITKARRLAGLPPQETT